MRTTAHRLLLLAPAALAAYAAGGPKDQIDYLADSLQKGDAAEALALFSPNVKDFARIKRDIEDLASLSGTECDIESGSGVPAGDAVEFDTVWKLQLNPKQNGPLLIRTGHIRISLRQKGGEWKIDRFAPLWILSKPDPAIFDRIAGLAGSLSEGNSSDAVSYFSPAIPSYGEISADLDALTSQADVLCAIDIVDDTQTETTHTLDTDWYLQLTAQGGAGQAERRRERVRIQMELIKGKWRITAFSPLDILAPIKTD